MNKTIIQIIRNMVTGWGVVGLQAAIGLYMVPFLLGHLGRDGYGVIGILMSVIGFAEIADLGLRAALNRELAEKVAKEDMEGFRALSSSALVLYLGIASVLVVAGWLLAPWLCSVFNVGDQYYALTVLLLRTFGTVSVVLSFITPIFTAGICSFMRYDIQNHVSMFSQVCISLSLFFVLTFVEANPLVIWCSVMGGGAMIRLLVMAIFYRRVCYGGKIAPSFVRVKELHPLFSLGGSMYVLQLTNVLAQRMDPLIVSRFIGLGGVALYQAGSKLPQMVKPIVLSAVNQLIPLTTKFHVTNNKKREQQILILGTKYTLYLGVIFSAGMILFADAFCHLWLFDKLGDDVKTVALVLKMWAAVSLFNYAGGPQWPIVLGKRKMRFSVWLSVLTSLFNVVLSIYLVGYTKLGVPGVLVGTVITEVVRRPIAAWYVSRLVGLKLRKYALDAYAAPAAYLILLIVPGYLLVRQSVFDGWGGLIVSGLLIGMWAFILLLIFEWRLIWSYLPRSNQ